MRRTLAVAATAGVLAAFGLLAGGCDKPAAPAPAPPAATVDQGTGPDRGTDDVDSLLNQVDGQLSADDQPPADQD
jgi:hypothetical protein